jgi:uncharacterized protein YwgA
MNETKLRLLTVHHLIQAAKDDVPWLGNLAIQKLIYLVEYVMGVQLGYTYGLHHLGPYSFDLAGDLDLGEQLGLWKITPVTKDYPAGPFNGVQYDTCGEKTIYANFKPDEATRSEAEKLWTVLQQRLEKLLPFVKDASGRDLELLATIHYLQTVQAVPHVDLWEILHALKPKYSESQFNRGLQKIAEIKAAADAESSDVVLINPAC